MTGAIVVGCEVWPRCVVSLSRERQAAEDCARQIAGDCARQIAVDILCSPSDLRLSSLDRLVITGQQVKRRNFLYFYAR